MGLGRGRLVPLASTKVHLVGRGPSWERGAKSRLERSGAGEVDRLRRCSARALGLVHPLPANESASIAGVGSGFESAFKGLERRVAVEEYPGRVAAHRALPGLVDYFSTHARNVDLEHRAVRVRSRSTAEGAGRLGAYLQGRRRAGRRRRSEAPRSRSWAQHVPIPTRLQEGGAARSAQWRCNERATDRSEPGGRMRLALTPASSSLTPNTSERHWPARRIHPGGRRTSGPQTAERNFRGRGKSRR